MATPGKNKTNFKTYEASTRLLAAVLATSNVKLDYAELAKHVGGGATKDAVNHRLRPIKQLAKMQASCIEKGQDPGALPVDKGEIQKLFGESTPAGIEWQFRDIKNLAKAQKQAVEKGQSPVGLLPPGTPSAGRGKGAAARTPGSGATTKTPTTGTRGRKRPAQVALQALDSSDDDSDCGIVDTPSKRPEKRPKTSAAATLVKKENGIVTTPAATHAKAANATATPTPAFTSIFGGDASAPAIMQSTEAFDDKPQTTTTRGARLSASATKPPKKEPMTGGNPFFGAADANAFEEGDNYEDGEV
ncbi:hypothetical protein O1611_g8121 [Lasiodiplodia mahajangana]|uniref:Uncharacterized protein n=1 Tax=Lasiodiplodia mahajangana TaxID=1108764 RepID=A0ACC2JDX9_9PEZI|nr:hypothetical protein O1611_g8121 [Lasiodiplodia mahajangana]